MKLLSTIACGALLSIPTVAMATDPAPLDVSAKALPAPTADISLGMQAFVAAPLNPNWNKLWKTGEEARAFADNQAADTVNHSSLACAPACQIPGIDHRRRSRAHSHARRHSNGEQGQGSHPRSWRLLCALPRGVWNA